MFNKLNSKSLWMCMYRYCIGSYSNQQHWKQCDCSKSIFKALQLGYCWGAWYNPPDTEIYYSIVQQIIFLITSILIFYYVLLMGLNIRLLDFYSVCWICFGRHTVICNFVANDLWKIALNTVYHCLNIIFKCILFPIIYSQIKIF